MMEGTIGDIYISGEAVDPRVAFKIQMSLLFLAYAIIRSRAGLMIILVRMPV